MALFKIFVHKSLLIRLLIKSRGRIQINRIFFKNLCDCCKCPCPCPPPPPKPQIFALKEVRRFIIDCLTTLGAPKKIAKAQGNMLIEADKRGHFSHGLNRLEMYILEIENGVCCPDAVPVVIKEHPSTALVDACNGLGGHAGTFCMKLAIRKAQETGVGWVCLKNANHFGPAAFYVTRAMKKNMIGVALTNSSPLMAPTRAKIAALGTNPISIGIPGSHDNEFLLDIATSAVAIGKMEIAKRVGKPIPEGWALDKEGNITTSAEKALEAATLMPLGGTELNSGYKGTGLAMLVDILTGVCAGANYATRIKKWMTFGEPANLGQLFAAINLCCFADDFKDRLTDFCQIMRCLPMLDPKKPVMVPGDIEREVMNRHRIQGGIIYSDNQMATCKKLSERLCVPMMRPNKRKLIIC